MSAASAPLGWAGIVRLGLVQAALGSVVVLATSTMNRVMVVELALPAFVPGALVALQYLVQVLRPRLGHGSDIGRRRTPWIVGGMAVLAAGGIAAALSVTVMRTRPGLGLAAAVIAYTLIGIGVGASGTSLLTLLARRVAPARRAPAATIVWLMMILGLAVTAGCAGHALDPFSPGRLVTVTAIVAALALCVTVLAVHGLEGAAEAGNSGASIAVRAAPGFAAALRDVWAEPAARRFAIFVFVSMLAYSAQELILEPFAGAVFGLTPGKSTALTGLQHGGVLAGMLLVAIAGGVFPGRMRAWTMGGCLASAAMLGVMLAAALAGPPWPLRPAVFLLGVANGTFAVAAIGAMMALAGTGRAGHAGLRMGLWGAAQAVAFAAGGLLATAGSDAARHMLPLPAAYAAVFAAEAGLFLFAAVQAAGVFHPAPRSRVPASLAPASLANPPHAATLRRG